MSSETTPVTIKKYANRRLYNTGTSAYVTLEDLAAMVKRGDDFIVYDAKSGDNITRSVLGQIIFEQEGKNGQSLLPITFLRQLIRFYGDSMQMLVPSYLEFSLDKLTKERSGFVNFLADGPMNAARPMFAQMEEQTRQNMAMFQQALSMFSPYAAAPPGESSSRAAEKPPRPSESASSQPTGAEYDDMRRQLEDLQRRLEGLSAKAS